MQLGIVLVYRFDRLFCVLVCVFIYLFVCVLICVFLMSVCLFICLFVLCLFLCLCVYLFVSFAFYVCVCLFLYCVWSITAIPFGHSLHCRFHPVRSNVYRTHLYATISSHRTCVMTAPRARCTHVLRLLQYHNILVAACTPFLYLHAPIQHNGNTRPETPTTHWVLITRVEASTTHWVLVTRLEASTA